MRYFVAHLAEDLPFSPASGPGGAGAHRSRLGAAQLVGSLRGGLPFGGPLGVGRSGPPGPWLWYERVDGKGFAGRSGRRGRCRWRCVSSPSPATVELCAARQAGWPAAVDGASGTAGGMPTTLVVVDAFVAEGERWLAVVGEDPCARVLDAEPGPVLWIGAADRDAALAAVADFADLKSVWLRGDSTGVARLVDAAARAAACLARMRSRWVGDPAGGPRRACRGTPSGIWDHPGRLSAEQWERVRLHPYLGERVLRRCGFLAPYADLAASHHAACRRLGISPRRLPGSARPRRVAAGCR